MSSTSTVEYLGPDVVAQVSFINQRIEGLVTHQVALEEAIRKLQNEMIDLQTNTYDSLLDLNARFARLEEINERQRVEIQRYEATTRALEGKPL